MALAPRTLLLALGLAACTDAAPPPAGAAAWRGGSSTDSTGAVRTAFLARDAEGGALEGQLYPPSLFLRCDADGPSVYVDWRTDLGHDTLEVTVALDDGPERTEAWAASSDRRAAGRWADSLAAPLVREMVEHDRLRLSLERDGGPDTWVFPLDGLGEASAPLRDACDV